MSARDVGSERRRRESRTVSGFSRISRTSRMVVRLGREDAAGTPNPILSPNRWTRRHSAKVRAASGSAGAGNTSVLGSAAITTGSDRSGRCFFGRPANNRVTTAR